MNEKDFSPYFFFERPIAFYESDAMGILHHSNYLRLFEEARLRWLRARGLEHEHYPKSELTLAVLETACRHLHPVHLGDDVKIYLAIRAQGLKIEFQYAIFTKRFEDPVALGTSLHVMLDKEFKVRRPPQAILQVLEKELWTETWR